MKANVLSLPRFVGLPASRPSTSHAPLASPVRSAGPAASCGVLATVAVVSATSRRLGRVGRRAEEKGAVQQLLGMKGAGETEDTPLWKRLGA